MYIPRILGLLFVRVPLRVFQLSIGIEKKLRKIRRKFAKYGATFGSDFLEAQQVLEAFVEDFSGKFSYC